MANILLSVAAVSFLLVAFMPQTDLNDLVGLLGFNLGLCLLGVIITAIIYITVPLLVQGRRQESLPPGLIKGLVQRHWQESRLWGVIGPCLAMAITIASFTEFKSRVFRSFPFSYDSEFTALDRALFAGHDPWRLTHSLFSTPEATAILDGLYHSWYMPMFIVYFASAVVVQKPEVRHTYMLAYLLSWLVIGMGMALLLLSAGPAFDGSLINTGGYFNELNDRLRAQAQEVGGLTALLYQQYLLDLRHLNEVRVGSGVSAMPSMHIALVSLWVIGSWKLHRIFGAVVLLYALLIWVASVHLAWHYAVDGIVSAVVVALIWSASERVLGYRRFKHPRRPDGGVC